MSLLYRGNILAKYVVDRAAAGITFDSIRLMVARDFDGQEISEDLYNQILKDNQTELATRKEEIIKKIDKLNPIGVMMDAVERLRDATDSTTDPKEISALLSTLRGYVETMLKRMGAEDKPPEQQIYIQQNYYMSLEEFARKGYIEIKKPAELKAFIGVEDEPEESGHEPSG